MLMYMTKVLLLNPPFHGKSYDRVARHDGVTISGSNWFPIHLAYATGLLENHNHAVRFLDAVASHLSPEEVVCETERFSPDIIIVNYSIRSDEEDLAMASELKCFGSPVVLVGPSCSIDPSKLLSKSNVDALVRGEYDFPTLDLAEGKSWKDIDGLSWKRDHGVIHNPDGHFVTSEQLNDFPFVTDVYRRHLNIRDYFQAPHLHPFIDLFTGRGCWYGQCTFCLWQNTIYKGAKYRVRKIENVVSELQFVRDELPFVKEVFVQDDTLPAWRARELSSAIMEANIDIVWSCYSRADIDSGTLRIMKEAGCRAIHVGFESFDLQILKNVKKGISPWQAERFAKEANKVGLQIHADFMLGLPGEDENTIKSTIKWAKGLPVDSYQFIVPKVYPSTPLYDWLMKNDCLKDGKVNYPHLSNEDLCRWSRIGTRQCVLSRRFITRYAKSILTSPDDFVRAVRVGFNILPHILG